MPKHLQGSGGRRKQSIFYASQNPGRLQSGPNTPRHRAGQGAAPDGSATSPARAAGGAGRSAAAPGAARPAQPHWRRPGGALGSPRFAGFPLGERSRAAGSRDPAPDDITAWARPFVCAPRGREGKKGKKKENFWKSLRFLRSSLLLADGPPSPPPARLEMPAYDF